MTKSRTGTGSAYAITVRDASGSYLDGSRTYKVTLPGPIPTKNFWSFTVYDNHTRSLLATNQKLAGLDSTFGPKAPVGHERNWVQTWPGKGYNVALRLYGPLEPWFTKTWRPGDLEEVK
jgi:hypothetical protein